MSSCEHGEEPAGLLSFVLGAVLCVCVCVYMCVSLRRGGWMYMGKHYLGSSVPFFFLCVVYVCVSVYVCVRTLLSP